MPKAVSLLLLGSFPFRALQSKKETLKGIFLFHNIELKCIFSLFFSDLLPGRSTSEVSMSVEIPNKLIKEMLVIWDLYGDNTGKNWLAGACFINLFQFNFPLSQNLATVLLLYLLVLLENCARWPFPSQLSHQNE